MRGKDNDDNGGGDDDDGGSGGGDGDGDDDDDICSTEFADAPPASSVDAGGDRGAMKRSSENPLAVTIGAYSMRPWGSKQERGYAKREGIRYTNQY